MIQIPDEAYALARGAGWEPKVTSICWEADALDPLFFQALGKALGWGRYMYVGKMERLLDDGKLEGDSWTLPVEEYHAHRFYDLILTNQSTEEFWSELLASPNKI